MSADASFAGLKIPFSHPNADDYARAFVAAGAPQALAAAGSTKTDAAAIVSRSSGVTGADGAKGVILPAADLAGHTRTVVNAGAQALFVYPDAGGTINGDTADDPVSVAPNQVAIFYKTAALTWRLLGESAVGNACTATAAGLTTGTIPTSGLFQSVAVTSASSANYITLPAPVPGTQLVIDVGANGYNLQSSAPATVAINGGTGASAKSAVGANVTLLAYCVSATKWKVLQMAAAGTVTALAAAA